RPRRTGGHLGQTFAIVTVTSCRGRVSSHGGTPAFGDGDGMRAAERLRVSAAGRGGDRFELILALPQLVAEFGGAVEVRDGGFHLLGTAPRRRRCRDAVRTHTRSTHLPGAAWRRRRSRDAVGEHPPHGQLRLPLGVPV